MKKVGIICNLMTGYGGVQVCVLELMKELNTIGIVPELISNVEPNHQLINNEGIDWTYNKVQYSIKESTYKKYSKFLAPINEFVYFFKTSWLKNKYDFIYFFQPNVLVDDNVKHLGYLSNSPISHYTKNKFNSRIKRIAYKYIIKHFHPVFAHDKYNCVINSQFTAQIFKDFFNKELEVVYPPNALKLEKKPIQKIENTVVCFSRISRAKRFEKIFPLAKNHPEYRFIIAGSLSNDNETYYKELLEQSKNMNLSNVEYIISPKHKEAIKLLGNAEFYVFFAINEHFGITTVEAINLGAIPFVHNSGGQKEIVPFENLRFDDIDMEDKFKNLLALNKEEKDNFLTALIKHVQKFDSMIYRKKLVSFLERDNE